jgi:hypothetical protein
MKMNALETSPPRNARRDSFFAAADRDGDEEQETVTMTLECNGVSQDVTFSALTPPALITRQFAEQMEKEGGGGGDGLNKVKKELEEQLLEGQERLLRGEAVKMNEQLQGNVDKLDVLEEILE